MKTLHYSIIAVVGISFGLSFCFSHSASAHIVPGFSILPDQNYVDPVTHYLKTKENHPYIVLSRDSEFTLPMILKSENGSRMTSYWLHVTDGNNFTDEIMPSGISIHVLPDHFIINNGGDQKFNIVIKVGKNAPSGIYEPNLVTKWNNNITESMDIGSISFQVGKWDWDSLSRQMESGKSAKNVVCKSNIQIVVIKSEDGSPACVKPDTAIVLVDHRWATNVLQPNPMAGLNNDTGIATLKNHAYYFETANYTDDIYHHPVKISFHDVIFTLFPSGFRGGLPAWGCGGSYYWTDAKFSDGTSELLQIFVGDQQCFVPQPMTHFSIHTNPQAGLTFYDGKMKLLVGTKNTLESSTRLNPIDVVSIQSLPTPPNPGGPTMQLTLMNIGMKPVTNLNATLALNNNYVFNFKDVTESNPLAPGHSTSDTEMLIGVGSTEMTHPLTVVGTENNETFSYTLNIHIPYTNENEIIKVRR